MGSGHRHHVALAGPGLEIVLIDKGPGRLPTRARRIFAGELDKARESAGRLTPEKARRDPGPCERQRPDFGAPEGLASSWSRRCSRTARSRPRATRKGRSVRWPGRRRRVSPPKQPRPCRSPALPRPSARPDHFIGLHFFFRRSKKMAAGRDHRRQEDLARDLGARPHGTSCRRSAKTPIVVNDSRGFLLPAASCGGLHQRRPSHA